MVHRGRRWPCSGKHDEAGNGQTRSNSEGGVKAAEKCFAHALRMLEMIFSPPQLFQLLSFFLLLLFLELFLLTVPHKW